MNPNEAKVITGEDFADLIIHYRGDDSNLKPYSVYRNSVVQIIDRNYAVVHIPAELITDSAISQFGIASIPSCFGLIPTINNNHPVTIHPNYHPAYSTKTDGVLIGIIDSGIDYTHPAFKYPNNSSKILSIWDQSISEEGNNPEDFLYGTEYKQVKINLALESNDPYSIVPSKDENNHGTLLAQVTQEAYFEAKNMIDLLPDAEYVIVKLKEAKNYLKNTLSISKNTICYQENDIMLGIKYLIEVSKKLNRPIAICMAQKDNLCSHDEFSFLNRYLSSVGMLPGVAIICAGGDEGSTNSHFFGYLENKREYEVMELDVASDEEGFSMEIWGDAPNVFSIDIKAPTGEYIPRIPAKLDYNPTYTYFFGKCTLYVNYIMVESQTGDQMIQLRFKNPIPGIWHIRIYSGKTDLPLTYHVWLPGQGFTSKNTYFPNSDQYTTICNPGNASVPITVSSYNQTTNMINETSGRGYTRANAIKPDICVPGLFLFDQTDQIEILSTCTSISAAYATGVAAILLDWGIVRKNHLNLNSFEVKKLMVRGALRDPNSSYPNPETGYGILNLYSTLNNIEKD